MQIPFIGRFYEAISEPPLVASPPPKPPKIGLALGAGAARGWAHIGVLQELEAQGIVPDVIAGASIGAVVGGCYAAGKLAEIEAFARSLTPRRIFSLMDITFSGAGLLGGGRLKTLLDRTLGDATIENLPIAFGAVATELNSGHEVWLTHGGLSEAVRASYALPGIFEPVRIGGRWLFDGALVNPVPVTVCRALGAEVVIAVNLISDSFSRAGMVSDALAPGRAGGKGVPPQPHYSSRDVAVPGIANALMDAFNITQDRIARSRLAGDPPDVMIKARTGKIGLFDFHRAAELIDMGRESVRRSLPDLLLETGLGAKTG